MNPDRKQLRFATVFPFFEDIHIVKDPGMIPYTMYHSYGFASVVPLSSRQSYEHYGNLLEGMDTPVIKDTESPKHNIRSRLLWIAKNAGMVDVLSIYFFDRYTWLSIWLYRLLNRKGLVYVHCDTDGGYLMNFQYPGNPLKRFLIKKILLTPSNLENTLWGVQNKEATERLRGTWPFQNIEYVPDGVFWPSETKGRVKKDQILTVSRNGAKQKRTDILLEGFARAAQEFPFWRLVLVGSVEDSFREYLDTFFAEHPDLKERITFTGPVYDRNRLEEIYSESKIFCLPSDWESFGIVTLEAISRGCYIVASDIPANRETTRNGEFGSLFEKGDAGDFADKLRAAMSDEKKLKENEESARKFAKENFSWARSLKPVYEWITQAR